MIGVSMSFAPIGGESGLNWADRDTDAVMEEAGRRARVPPTIPLVRISAAT
jgi:hypothetical protein